MKTFKKISLLAILWFAVWVIFIAFFQNNGVDYVHNTFVTCTYFSAVIYILYRFFISPTHVKGDHFSIKELGIASASIIVSSIAYYLLNNFVIPEYYDSIRTTLHYSLRIDNAYLITKAFEIMFQQAFFMVSIGYLFKNGLSTAKDVFLFGVYMCVIHVPLFFVVPFSFGCIMVVSSFFAGMIFSYFIVKYKDGFMWSYLVHYWFYILLGAGYWFLRLGVFN